MTHITLLTSVLSYFLITISADVQDMIVDKIHIDINLYPTSNSHLIVTCHYVFNNLRTTTKISMYYIKHFAAFEDVSLIKKDTDMKIDFIYNDYNPTTNIYTFYFKTMDPGLYVMNVTFWKDFEPAFYQIYSDRIHEKEVMWLSSTHFQPIWIQRIIPCWVRPKEDGSFRDMPTFNLFIWHPAHYSVLTNMPKRKERLDEKALGRNMKLTYFDTTPQMSPYQLSIVVTNFTRTIIDKDDDVSMWCRKRSASSLQFGLTIARDITSYLQNSKQWPRCRFSTKVKLIVIPKIQTSSTESFPERDDSLVHPGIIIANEHDITYEEGNDTVGRKYNVIRLLGYKVMQEYYEWIVNPYWEPSTWLSKGFATFIATHNLNQIWPNLRMIDLFVVQVHHECLDFDVNNGMLPFPDQNNDTVPDEIINNLKGSVFLRMVQHVYKAEVFREAINTFIYKSIIHKKENHPNIFWSALEDAVDETAYSLYNTNDFIHHWENKKGYLVLTVKRDYNSTTSTMKIIPLLKDFNLWKETRSIPLSYTTRTYMDFTQTLPRSWIIPPYTSPPYKLDLNYTEHSWIIFNIQQTGYYRVNYDDENWARISTYLNNEDYSKIHVLNRAQLIDDAFQFMLLDQLKADVFWQLTKYLERETDYIAWYPMFKAIEYMSTTFHLYADVYLIKQKIYGLLNKLFWNINYEERLTDNDFTKALRQEAVQWACFFKLPRCITEAYSQLRRYLDASIKFFSPCWKKRTYCYGLTKASDIIWNQTLSKMEENYNDKILYLVTCPNHLVEIKNYTSTYTNNDDESHVTPSTMVQLQLKKFVNTLVESLKRDEVYNIENDTVTYKDNTNITNLLDNFANEKFRQLKLSTAFLIFINNVYSIKHLFKIWDTFVLKDNPNNHIWEKLEARRIQLMKYELLFARIKPKN